MSSSVLVSLPSQEKDLILEGEMSGEKAELMRQKNKISARHGDACFQSQHSKGQGKQISVNFKASLVYRMS